MSQIIRTPRKLTNNSLKTITYETFHHHTEAKSDQYHRAEVLATGRGAPLVQAHAHSPAHTVLRAPYLQWR
jgi:hypothetical protein